MAVEYLLQYVVVDEHAKVMLFEKVAHGGFNFCGVFLGGASVIVRHFVLLYGLVEIFESLGEFASLDSLECFLFLGDLN